MIRKPTTALDRLVSGAQWTESTTPIASPQAPPTLVDNAYKEEPVQQPPQEQESLPVYADEHIPPAQIPRTEKRMVQDSLEEIPMDAETKRIRNIQNNMGDVAHTVDPQRSAIMMQLGANTLLAMQEQGKQPVPMGDLIGINDGPERTNQFIESLQTMGKYANRFNYLDMELDPDTGQERVAQTHFNPQRNDWIGYVTGGEPVTFKKGGGSKAEQTFHDQLSASFFGGQDVRRAMKNGMFKQVADEGKQIRESMLSSEATNRALQVMSHIGSDGESISIPEEVGTVPHLQLPERFVKKYLMDEQGKMSMDGLKKIELAVEASRYADTKHDEVFSSSMNVTMPANSKKIDKVFSKPVENYTLPVQDGLKTNLVGVA